MGRVFGKKCDVASHGFCEEGAPLHLACHPCLVKLCAVQPSCCDTAWDQSCVQSSLILCETTCKVSFCGDGKCGKKESKATCPQDCGG